MRRIARTFWVIRLKFFSSSDVLMPLIYRRSSTHDETGHWRHRMLAMKPTIETPTSRLVELVQLLAETSPEKAFDAVHANEVDATDDPWWIVAGALVALDVRRPRRCAERAGVA